MYMGELKMSGAGLLGDMFRNLKALGLTVMPQLQQNELVLEITEEDFKKMALGNLDERAKNSISVKLTEGKLIIKIRLF